MAAFWTDVMFHLYPNRHVMCKTEILFFVCREIDEQQLKVYLLVYHVRLLTTASLPSSLRLVHPRGLASLANWEHRTDG